MDPQILAARLNRFAAAQLWLLLSLVGDESTEDQRELREIIEGKTALKIQPDRLGEVKMQLEEEIMQGYEDGHCLGLYSARVIECILEHRSPQSNNHSLAHRIHHDLKGVLPELRGLASFLGPHASAQPGFPQPEEPSPRTHELNDSGPKDTGHVQITVGSSQS
ncbi:hypothetical protein RSOL_142380, partial [Rhizoctonia solani AG-3 Rhs1AP]